MVNGVTKSSGQGSTGVLAPIREWPPGGWRGKRGRGRDSQGSQGAPLTGSGDETAKRQLWTGRRYKRVEYFYIFSCGAYKVKRSNRLCEI